jgi:hypothetical protein
VPIALQGNIFAESVQINLAYSSAEQTAMNDVTNQWLDECIWCKAALN